MSGLFGGSSTPPPPPPPAQPAPPPTIDQAKESRMAADELRRRQGRAASILSQPRGMLANGQQPMTATKKLTGE